MSTNEGNAPNKANPADPKNAARFSVGSNGVAMMD